VAGTSLLWGTLRLRLGGLRRIRAIVGRCHVRPGR
jgi:hypothetical protein